jgi:FlaA1/EpsC-like NDP-sugar epimerase
MIKKLLKNIFNQTKLKRTLFFLATDTLLFSLSFILAFLLRFDFNIPESYRNILYFWLPIIVIFKLLAFWFTNIYSFNWRYIGLEELVKVSLTLLFTNTILFVINIFLQVFFNPFSIPKSVIIIDLLLSLILTSFLRILKRAYLELLNLKKKGKNTLIIGAGNTGERIARALIKDENFNPVAFVDDNPNKIGTTIHGIPVLGNLKNISKIIRNNRIETAIIAIPSLNHRKIKEIYNSLRESGIKDIKIVPSIKNLPNKIEISTKTLKDISIEDLLFREEIKIDKEKIKNLIKGKTVLVTGAGGSIGSEIVRQLLDFEPKKIIAFEIDETELHNLNLEIKDKLQEKNVEFIPIVGDIRDIKKLERVFKAYKPGIVFHAAAYKHVPLMEYFPEEAIKTNVFGTYNLAKVSVETGVEKFVNISTDKAVNPSSIMGATKRLAEIICNSFNQLEKTKFVSVRFGNVLGSRGSVVPIFLEQIKKGGPVTVTHPEMKRYFMTIPEAVLLVFQAAAMGKGGEIFVLDMGEPVKILTLAEELIRLHGLEPYKDIDIVFTGLRPGEKLFEELLTAEEGTDKTYHEKVFIARNPKVLPLEELEKYLKELGKLIEKDIDVSVIKAFFSKLFPFYKGN